MKLRPESRPLTRMSAPILYALTAWSMIIPSSPAFARTCRDLFSTPFAKVSDAKALRLQNKDGSIALFPANSYYLQTSQRSIVETVLARRADVQARIDESLTNGHARNGNTFQKKNPVTGLYDQEFSPRVNGAVIPLEKEFFDQQIQSMAPVARSLRFLLQKIYTSGDLFTRYREAGARDKSKIFSDIIKHLGLTKLPANEQRRIVDIVAESIYFEQAMIGRDFKNYGFLPVIGFDAAINTLEKVTAIYYEFNSGTPSGLSNNVQLQELVRQKDPELYQQFKDQIIDDNTFQNLRYTIESNAAAWTGDSSGISVIVGPGSFNGANPDVSAISAFSGMPMVRAEDLYVGKDGFVYLNSGPGTTHRKVTGIYSRVEESAFLNSAEEGIPWVTPHLDHNVELGEKIGIPLRNGVNYVWKKNDKDEIVGVEVDEKGKPRIEQFSLGQIGQSPNDPKADRKSFAWAIKNKKLYFSGLGGRVIDDKRVFEIAKDHLARGFMFPSEKGPIAGPPRTLGASEVNEFYAAPEKFVVKVPDESGGVGVYLGPLLSKSELQAVVAKVKADRDQAARTGAQPVLTIQEFTTAAILTTPVQKENSWKWGTTVPDIRFFVFQDDKGNVRAGGNSFLVRAARHLSPSTNTSQGAGYGIGVVVDSKKQGSRPADKSLLPIAKTTKLPLAYSYSQNLSNFLESFREVYEMARQPNAETRLREMAPHNPYNVGFFDPNIRWSRLEILVQMHKEIIAVLGLDSSYFMTALKEFQAGKISLQKFNREMAEFRTKLLAKNDYQYRGVREKIEGYLTTMNVPGLRASSNLRPTRHGYFVSVLDRSRPAADVDSLLKNHVELEYLKDAQGVATPSVVRETSWYGTPIEIVQIGTVKHTSDKTINGYIADLKAMGGEVRYIRQREKGGKFLANSPAAEFGITDDGRPFVEIDLAQSQFLAGISHEMVHFADWKSFYDKARKAGLSHIDAAKRALSQGVDDIDFQRSSEERAVQAERVAEKDVNNVFNGGPKARPTEFWEDIEGYTYISRILYPDITAISRHLHKIRWEKADPSAADRRTWVPRGQALTERYFRRAIVEAAQNRKATHAYLLDVYAKYKDHPDYVIRTRAERAYDRARALEKSTLFELIFRKEEINQFANRGILDVTAKIYQRVEKALVKEGVLESETGFPAFGKTGVNQMMQQQQQ